MAGVSNSAFRMWTIYETFDISPLICPRFDFSRFMHPSPSCTAVQKTGIDNVACDGPYWTPDLGQVGSAECF